MQRSAEQEAELDAAFAEFAGSSEDEDADDSIVFADEEAESEDAEEQDDGDDTVADSDEADAEVEVSADGSAEDEAEVPVQRAPSSPPGPPETIPYGRFQEVYHQSKEAEKRALALEQELAAIRAKQEPEEPKVDWLDQLESEDVDPVVREGLASLRTKVQTLESERMEERNRTLMANEIARIRQDDKYAAVPDDLLYEAVERSGTIEGMQKYADAYLDYEKGIEARIRASIEAESAKAAPVAETDETEAKPGKVPTKRAKRTSAPAEDDTDGPVGMDIPARRARRLKIFSQLGLQD